MSILDNILAAGLLTGQNKRKLAQNAKGTASESRNRKDRESGV
jgi:hypothetical protein